MSERQEMRDSSHLFGGNVTYIECLYEAYLRDVTAVPAKWREYFDQLPKSNGKDDVSHQAIQDHFAALARQTKLSKPSPRQQAVPTQRQSQAHVLQLINAYRLHGHHQAKLDPLGLAGRKEIPDLELRHHQLSESDLSTTFSSESPLTANGSNLQEIYQALRRTYCGSMGVEYMHITDNEQIEWLQQRLESVQGNPNFSKDEKLAILQRLSAAEGLEKYLGSKYVGQKRFSLEGSDSLIPMLHELIERATMEQVQELIIGMAHRGRLNVLINVLGKSPEELFQEFEGKHVPAMSGDVKYHMGFSSDIQTEHGVIHLALAFNPSHLEVIAPVVQGSVRSRQRRRGDVVDKKQVVPVLIHGDAAFAGQGVVMETFNFSKARGYSTGGTIHIVINNQIGFTTSNPLDARSTLYCTDVAKMVQAPIFHVNGDDPEAAVFSIQLALDFRMRFKRDVVVDLVCYRRHGHNEADEPSITQPLMYQAIKSLPTTRQIYSNRLSKEGVLTQEESEAMVSAYRDALDQGKTIIKTVTEQYKEKYLVRWQSYLNKSWREPADTGLPITQLKELGVHITRVPKGFELHPVVKRLCQERDKMTSGEIAINWGYAEIMAYASLLMEGYPVRLSGQDSGRGTFSHRHAVVYDQKTRKEYIPLQHMEKKQEQFVIIDSVLSEEAVLGFEYGFAAAEPNVLIIWEAQFGDFANGAQVIIDQFISSGEQKWGRLCGLVMLLPHGYEGQGPEHSSARLERYLQLCAQHNMQICIPSTPAQMFHLLRRQMIRPFRKPLIVMTPKSLLRHKLATSSLEDLVKSSFQLVIPEVDDLNTKAIRKVILCSGKVYYDLLEERRKLEQVEVAIVRIEQLYPFPQQELSAELKRYKHVQEIVWCQEEPKNQGAWYSSQHHMRACLQEDQHLFYVGRDFCASPAVGYFQLHQQQQEQLISDALT